MDGNNTGIIKEKRNEKSLYSAARDDDIKFPIGILDACIYLKKTVKQNITMQTKIQLQRQTHKKLDSKVQSKFT